MRVIHTEEAAGSNPGSPTLIFPAKTPHRRGHRRLCVVLPGQKSALSHAYGAPITTFFASTYCWPTEAITKSAPEPGLARR